MLCCRLAGQCGTVRKSRFALAGFKMPSGKTWQSHRASRQYRGPARGATSRRSSAAAVAVQGRSMHRVPWACACPPQIPAGCQPNPQPRAQGTATPLGRPCVRRPHSALSISWVLPQHHRQAGRQNKTMWLYNKGITVSFGARPTRAAGAATYGGTRQARARRRRGARAAAAAGARPVLRAPSGPPPRPPPRRAACTPRAAPPPPLRSRARAPPPP
jgi:hypothetical protein